MTRVHQATTVLLALCMIGSVLTIGATGLPTDEVGGADAGLEPVGASVDQRATDAGVASATGLDAGAEGGTRDAAPSSSGSGTRAGSGNASAGVNITLVTGQVIRVVGSGEDRDVAIVEADVPMQIADTPEGTFVFPAGTNFSRFDRSLFNVDLLIEQNLTDADTDGVPVIITRSGDAVEPRRSGDGAGSTGDSGLGEDVAGLSVDRQLGLIDAVAGMVRKGEAGAVADHLASSDRVAHVYLDRKLRVSLDVAAERVNAARARSEFNVSGENVTVAVLDTGVDTTHPDLDDAVIDQRDFTGDGIGDRNGHGTHVAGIVAGDGTASNGTYVGIAPNASILSVKVLGDDGVGSTSGIIDGIEYALNYSQDGHTVDIISMSLGGPVEENDPLTVAADRAARNTTVVIAAGNDGPERFTVGSPANAERAIAVGASDDADQLADFSSRGPTPIDFRIKPDLVAPGVAIASAEAGTEGYVNLSGTSMATPVVSGVAALLEEARNVSPSETKSLLASTSDPLVSSADGATYSVYEQGAGRVNATAALGADLLVRNASVDFGVFGSNTTATRVVAVTNVGDTARTVNVSTTLENTVTGARYASTVNVSTVTIDPGETEHIALTVDTGRPEGIYSGRLSIGDYVVAYGFTNNAQEITIEKQALSGQVDDVQYDPVFIRSAFTSPSRWTATASITNGTATLLAFEGNYTVFSTGIDESSGETVLLKSEIEVTDQSTRFTIDEANTVRYSIDTGALNDGNPLETLDFEALLQSGGFAYYSYRFDETSIPTAARVSTGPDVNVSLDTLLAPASYYSGSGDTSLDTPTAYHLVYGDHGVSGNRTFTPNEPNLARMEFSFYRATPDETYSMYTFADNASVDPFDVSIPWAIRDNRGVRIYTTNNTDYEGLPVKFDGSGGPAWELQVDELAVRSVNESYAAAVNHPPYTPRGTWFTFSDDETGVKKFGFFGSSWSDQPPAAFEDRTGFYADDVLNSYVVRDGSGAVVANRTGDGAFYFETNFTDGASYNITTIGSNPDLSLGSKVIGRYQGTLNASGDGAPPNIVAVQPADMSLNSGVPNGTVTVSIFVEEAYNLSDITAGWAPVSVSSRAFAGSGLASEWNAATNITEIGRLGPENNVRQIEVEFNISGYAGRVHLAFRATDSVGNTMSTTTYNAIYVGKQTYDGPQAPAESVTVTGQINESDGSPAANDRLDVATEDGFKRTTTDENGRFSFDLPPNAEYQFGYYQNGSVSDAPRDGSPDLFTTPTVFIGENDTDLGSGTLPNASVLNVTVVGPGGAPVENATVSVAHIRPQEGGYGTAPLSTNAEGKLVREPGVTPGVEVVGNITIRVEPPANSPFVDRTYEREVLVDSDRSVTIELERQAVITGRIETPNGTPAANDSVGFDPGPGLPIVRTDGSGNFTFTATANTTYSVGYFQVNESGSLASVGDRVVDFAALGVINSSTGVDLGTLTLPEAHLLNVRVVDESGDPVPNATIRFIDTKNGFDRVGFVNLSVNQDGYLRADPDGTTGIEVNGSTRVVVEPPSDSGFVDEPTIRTVNVTSDRNVTVTLAQTVAELNGTITEPDGSPAADDVIALFTGGGISLTTDSQGRYSTEIPKNEAVDIQFYQTENGSQLTFAPRDGVPDIFVLDRVNITQPTTVDARLPNASVLNVTVISNQTGDPVRNATVDVSHLNDGGDGGLANIPTNANGLLQLYQGLSSRDLPPGIEVNGSVRLTVAPPPNSTVFEPRTYTRNLTVTNDTNVTVRLDRRTVNTTLSIGNASTIVNGTTTVTVTLDELPYGLSGYNLTVSAANGSVVEVVNGSVSDAFAQSKLSVRNGTALTAQAADLDDAIQPGATDVPILSVTVKGAEPGETDLRVTVREMDTDPPVSRIAPRVEPGRVSVVDLPAVGTNPPPTDPDNDGVFEDVNGNGRLDFQDVVALFDNYTSSAIQNHPDAYDFNDNGMIDFDDIVTLFESI